MNTDAPLSRKGEGLAFHKAGYSPVAQEGAETAGPTFEQMKEFLVARYRLDRLYGRTKVTGWPDDYGDSVVRGHLNDLRAHGIDNISRHESLTGRAVWIQFVNGSLREVDGDTARAALRRNVADRGTQLCASAGTQVTVGP